MRAKAHTVGKNPKKVQFRETTLFASKAKIDVVLKFRQSCFQTTLILAFEVIMQQLEITLLIALFLHF